MIRTRPTGTFGEVTTEQLWQRLDDFLHEVVPVAEEAGVRLAAHPDDPPLPSLARHRPAGQPARALPAAARYPPQPANALEFCLGTIAEMNGEMDVYEAIDTYSRQRPDRLRPLPQRARQGARLPRGLPRRGRHRHGPGALRIYHKNGYDGVIIPDHTPQMACAAPWHAGMAYALGWMAAALRFIEAEPAVSSP